MRHDAWSARPYEKVSDHGFFASSAFIALSVSDASSSDMPPERNVTPGTATGTVCCSTRTVASAT